jgi:hypothetical protein
VRARRYALAIRAPERCKPWEALEPPTRPFLWGRGWAEIVQVKSRTTTHNRQPPKQTQSARNRLPRAAHAVMRAVQAQWPASMLTSR